MKRTLIPLILIIALGCLIVGCSDDEETPTGPNGPTTVTVTAATGTTAPARFSTNDTVWNRISPVSISISDNQLSSSTAKQPGREVAAVAGSVAVQAIVVDDTLYMKLAWDDDTHDAWPARFAVTDFDEFETDTLAVFTQDALSFNEDQLMLFFQAPETTVWEIWNWRGVTTGSAGVAEGFNFDGASLVRDAGSFASATSNLGQAGQPAWMDPQSPGVLPNVISQWDVIAVDHSADWNLGDQVPGYVINDSIWMPQWLGRRDSRYDVMAGYIYSLGSSSYTVVLSRALNTGHADDLDFSGQTTLNMKVGITNNADFVLTQGDTRQGFSATFHLALP